MAAQQRDNLTMAPKSTAPDPPDEDPPPRVVMVGQREVVVATRTIAHPYEQAYCTLCRKWKPNECFQIDPKKPGKPLRTCMDHGLRRPGRQPVDPAALPPAPGSPREEAEAEEAERERVVGQLRSRIHELGGGAAAIDVAFAEAEVALVEALMRRALSGDLPAMRLAMERAERGRGRLSRPSAAQPAAEPGAAPDASEERLAPAELVEEDWQALQRGDVGPAGPAPKPHDVGAA